MSYDEYSPILLYCCLKVSEHARRTLGLKELVGWLVKRATCGWVGVLLVHGPSVMTRSTLIHLRVGSHLLESFVLQGNKTVRPRLPCCLCASEDVCWAPNALSSVVKRLYIVVSEICYIKRGSRGRVDIHLRPSLVLAAGQVAVKPAPAYAGQQRKVAEPCDST